MICIIMRILDALVNATRVFITRRWAAVGGVLNGRPLICGGFNGAQSFKDCFYVEGKPAENVSMTRIRSFATSTVLRGKYI